MSNWSIDLVTGNTFAKRLKDGLFGHLLACLVELYVCWEHVSIIHPPKTSEQIYIYICLLLIYVYSSWIGFNMISLSYLFWMFHFISISASRACTSPGNGHLCQVSPKQRLLHLLTFKKNQKKTQVKEGPSKKYGWTMFEHVWPFTKTRLIIYRLCVQEYNSIRRWQDIFICFYGPGRTCASPNSLNEQHRKTHILSVTMWAGGVSKTHRPEASLHHLVFFLLLLWLWCWTDLR